MNGEIISLGDIFHMKLGLMVTMRWVIMIMMSKYFYEIAAHVGYKFKKNEQKFHDDDRKLHDKDKVIIKVCENYGEEVDFLFFKGLIEVYLEDKEAEEFVNNEGKDFLEWNCGNIDSDESMTSF